VRSEKLDGVAIAVHDPHLLVHGIRLDVAAQRPLAMLVAEARRAAEVEDRVGRPVELAHLGRRVAVPAISEPVPIGPAIREVETPHDVREEGDVRVGAGPEAAARRVVRRSAGVLDVEDVASERAEPDEVLDRLPGHARHRVLRRDPEQDDPWSARHPTAFPAWRPNCAS